MEHLSEYISWLVSVISIMIGVAQWRIISPPFKLIVIQTVVGSIVDFIGMLMYKVYDLDNIFVYNIYLIVDVFFIVLCLIKLMNNDRYTRYINYSLFACVAVYIYCLLTKGISTFANWAFLCECTLVVVFFLKYMIDSYLSQRTEAKEDPAFWLALGMILYYGCSIPYFGISNYLINNNLADARKLYLINDLLRVIQYCLISYSFVVFRDQYVKGKAYDA